MISHEMTRTMETALAEWVRLQAAALVQAANTETAAHVVIGLLAWASDQGNCDPSDPIASMAQDAAERQFVKASPCVPTPESAPAQETTGSA